MTDDKPRIQLLSELRGKELSRLAGAPVILRGLFREATSNCLVLYHALE